MAWAGSEKKSEVGSGYFSDSIGYDNLQLRAGFLWLYVCKKISVYVFCGCSRVPVNDNVFYTEGYEGGAADVLFTRSRNGSRKRGRLS